jgi:uncharacterized protein (TIGR00299 family) protein
VGGIAGDMFAAAMLDALPALGEPLMAALSRLAPPDGVAARLEAFGDGILTGARFVVTLPDEAPDHPHHHDHDHRSFREIRGLIDRARLEPAVAERAIQIFQLLAEAEAAVHGVPVEDVAFHEVGAWDSIIDIVSAAYLIEHAGARSWSVAPLPLGSGRVRTRHGDLPVPAPAVALLIKDFAVIDDGRPGERVTPTGAAILRHLVPAPRPPAGVLRHDRVGYGFGTKRFEGLSNVLRVQLLVDAPADAGEEEVGQIGFEVDDQTAEDLAIGLERLREFPGVLDVLQAPAFGKKGRLVAQIQVLTRADALDAVAERCFVETTTLGVRLTRLRRRVLQRESAAIAEADGGTVRVKRARRPGGGMTVKAEIDDIARGAGDHRQRMARRRRVEAAALPDEDSTDA